MIFDLFPRPTVLGHRSQITEGPVRRPFFYTKNTQAGQRRRAVGFLLYVQVEFHCLKGSLYCPTIFLKKLFEFRAARVKLGRFPFSLVDVCLQRCCHWRPSPSRPSQYLYSVDYTNSWWKERVCGCLRIYSLDCGAVGGFCRREVWLNLRQPEARLI